MSQMSQRFEESLKIFEYKNIKTLSKTRGHLGHLGQNIN